MPEELDEVSLLCKAVEALSNDKPHGIEIQQVAL